MLNFTFHGNIFDGTGSPAVQYTGSEVRYRAFFYKVGGGSSPSAWSGLRTSILGQYNINLGDGDWLGQPGIVNPTDQVVIAFWTPNTSVRTDTNLSEWALTTFTIGSWLPGNPNKVIVRDVELRPAQIPNCVASNSFADPQLMWNDLGSNDIHTWPFMGNTMEHRPTLFGENMFSGMNVIDFIEIDWGNTVTQTGLTPGGSYPYTYPYNGSFTSEFKAYNVGGEYCSVTQPVVVTNAAPAVLSCDYSQVKAGCGYKYTATVSGGTAPYTYKWEVYEGSELLAELDGPSDIFEYNWPKIGTFDVVLTVTDTASPANICTTSKTFPVTECPIEIRTIVKPGTGGGAPARNQTAGVPYMHYADRYREVTDEFDKLEQRIRTQVRAELVGELIQTEQINYTQAIKTKSHAEINVDEAVNVDKQEFTAELVGEVIHTETISYEEKETTARVSVVCLNENPEAMLLDDKISVNVEHAPDVAAQILNKPIFEKLEVTNPNVLFDSSFISVSGKIDPRHELNRYVKIEDYDITVESVDMGSEMESIEEGNIYIDLLEVYR